MYSTAGRVAGRSFPFRRKADGCPYGACAGPAEVYVSATVRGVYVAAKIAVTIRDAGIAFDIANCMPNESGGYSLELYTLAADGFADALTPALTVFENGTELEDPDVSWQSNDSAVVRVEGNESFVAVGEGETQVIGTYKDASVAVSVKVTRTGSDWTEASPWKRALCRLLCFPAIYRGR